MKSHVRCVCTALLLVALTLQASGFAIAAENKSLPLGGPGNIFWAFADLLASVERLASTESAGSSAPFGPIHASPKIPAHNVVPDEVAAVHTGRGMPLIDNAVILPTAVAPPDTMSVASA